MKKYIFLLAIVVTLTGCCRHADTVHTTTSLLGYEIINVETEVDDRVIKQLEVVCPGSKYALGAGWSVEDSTSAILEGEALHFQMAYDGKGWLVNAKNNSAFSPNWKLRVRCICAEVSSVDSTATE